MTFVQNILTTNSTLAQEVVEDAIRNGILEFCVAPGSRNSPLVYALNSSNQVKIYIWSEERSAAFFALGRTQATKRPVAIVTTSGTAAAECLPAIMNAHYLGLPLLVITADRPRRFRGTGAPQTAEQVGLFGCYTHFDQDLTSNDICNLSPWVCKGPAHLNICFEEPNESECLSIKVKKDIPINLKNESVNILESHLEQFQSFINQCKFPLVVIGGLSSTHKDSVVEFLLQLNAPVYAEAFSNLREDDRLKPIRITRIDQIWKNAEKNKYPIDGILRIGEIPTARLWRDLEEKAGQVKVFSICEQPFSGLSWSSITPTSIPSFCTMACSLSLKTDFPYHQWLEADHTFYKKLSQLIIEEPLAEPSLIHSLSQQIPSHSQVFLGNSLPIREWDLAATYKYKHFRINATRGVNGIDGQISNFLGLCNRHVDNWGLLGDLTALYDMAGPWILHQMEETPVNLVIVNNQGGQIFSRMYKLPIFTNPHSFGFEHLAAFWKMKYELWKEIPSIGASKHHRLIEIIPDGASTERFWNKMAQL